MRRAKCYNNIIKAQSEDTAMKVKEKIWLDKQGLTEHGPINIVIFGDSISHGAINGYFDYESVYWNRLRKKLNQLNDYMPVNMINSAIGGATAAKSLPRLERCVLKHEPDLVIVCFGLNDVNRELEEYLTALEGIFRGCQRAGLDLIFMTPNMMNTYVAEGTPEKHFEYAHKTAQMQNGGKVDRYINAAKELALSLGVTVCDCYAEWKKLSATTDTTMLLANRINHPVPEMHELFAKMLYDTILSGDCPTQRTAEDAMFEG